MCQTFITFLLILFVACTSQKETILNHNPDFIKQAYKLRITSPLSHDNPAFNKFIIEDLYTNSVHEIQPLFEETDIRRYKVEDEIYNDDLYSTQEFEKHNFSIVNPLDDKEYIISGEKSFIRTREGEDDVIIGTGKNEFYIYSDEYEIGKITVKNPNPTIIYNPVFPIELSFHSQNVQGEYQKILNKKSLSFKDENGLLALFAFDTEGFIATKYSGDGFIKQGLTNESRSDIIAMFVISDIVMSIVEKVRF